MIIHKRSRHISMTTLYTGLPVIPNLYRFPTPCPNYPGYVHIYSVHVVHGAHSGVLVYLRVWRKYLGVRYVLTRVIDRPARVAHSPQSSEWLRGVEAYRNHKLEKYDFSISLRRCHIPLAKHLAYLKIKL